MKFYKIFAVFTALIFFVSCATTSVEVGKPYFDNANAESELVVNDILIKKMSLVGKLHICKRIPKKRNNLIKDRKESKKLLPFFIGAGCLALSYTGGAAVAMLFGFNWIVGYNAEFRVHKETIGTKEEKQFLSNKTILVNVKNINKTYRVTSDHNGIFKLKLTKEFLKNDVLDIEFGYKDLRTTTNVNILDYYKDKYVLNNIDDLEFLFKYKDEFFKLSAKEREYVLNNLNSFHIKDDWSILSVFVSAKINNYLNPIFPVKPAIPPVIKEPQLPPVMEAFEKSVFESRKTFRQRMASIKEKRELQIQDIVAKYESKVNARNQHIAEIRKDYQNKYKQYEKEVAYRRKNKSVKENSYLVEYFPKIFGYPKLAALHTNNGTPQYDAENEMMFAKLYYGNKINPKLEKTVVFQNVKEGKYAQDFYENLNNSKMQPKVFFNFSNNYFNIESVTLKNKEFANIFGKTSFEKFKEKKRQKVVLTYKNYSIQSPKKYEIADLKPQSSYIKDVQLDIYIARELSEFNDDIPALLEETSQRKIDKSKWLFVIGIEDYKKTNSINFSKRSAEMFTKLAMKRLGIYKNNVFLLTDDGKTKLDGINPQRVYQATAGSIQDQLRYLVRDIDKGDKIYFYYSGHGIPSIQDGKKPYILARDQAPEFISKDKNFSVQHIYNLLSNSKASQIIAFMDSCFTGETDGKSVFQGSKASTRLVPENPSFDKKRMVVIYAGTGKQFSNMYEEKGHRLFSYYLMKGLLKDYREIGDLFKEVQTNTRSTSREMGGSNIQEPTIKGNKELKL